MAATKQEIRDWVERGKNQKGCTHVIIVCDDFDYEDYPVYVTKGQDIKERIKHFQEANMQRIMEVYSMSLDIESQLNESRAYHV